LDIVKKFGPLLENSSPHLVSQAGYGPASSSNNTLHFFTTFLIEYHQARHNQLPAIVWNFYYDATKLLQADNCIIITSNWMPW